MYSILLVRCDIINRYLSLLLSAKLLWTSAVNVCAKTALKCLENALTVVQRLVAAAPSAACSAPKQDHGQLPKDYNTNVNQNKCCQTPCVVLLMCDITARYTLHYTSKSIFTNTKQNHFVWFHHGSLFFLLTTVIWTNWPFKSSLQSALSFKVQITTSFRCHKNFFSCIGSYRSRHNSVYHEH